MLAILPAMTWTLRSMAAMPVAAVSSARILRSPQSPEELTGRLLRQLLQRVAALVALLLQDGGDVAVAAGDLDHPRHLGDGIDVRFLDRALHDAGAGRRRAGIDAVRRHDAGAGILLSGRWRWSRARRFGCSAGRAASAPPDSPCRRARR